MRYDARNYNNRDDYFHNPDGDYYATDYASPQYYSGRNQRGRSNGYPYGYQDDGRFRRQYEYRDGDRSRRQYEYRDGGRSRRQYERSCGYQDEYGYYDKPSLTHRLLGRMSNFYRRSRDKRRRANIRKKVPIRCNTVEYDSCTRSKGFIQLR